MGNFVAVVCRSGIDNADEDDSSLERLERLDNHRSLQLVGNKQFARLENGVEGVDKFVQGTRRTSLLCETRNGEPAALAMLNDSHDLNRKSELLDTDGYNSTVSIRGMSS